jgi:YidC/Oxa1 family membrane protein insertase
MMDKRTIGIVIACMLALFALQMIVNKIYPPVPKKPKPVVTNLVEAVTNTVEQIKPATPAVEISPPAPPGPTEPAKIVTLSNAFVRVEFTSRGGGISSVELLRHKANGHGNTVLNGPEFPPSLSLAGASNDVFDIQQTEAHTVVMRDAAGITKTFSLTNDYVIAGSIRAPSASQFDIVVGTATPTQPHETPSYLVVDWQGASKFRNRTQPRVADRVKAGKPHEDIHAGWVAVKSQYFAMVLTPTTNVTGVTYASVNVSAGPPPEHGVTATADVPATRDADGSASCTFTFYVGPKEYDRLMALGKNQDELMDFGTPMDFYSGFFGYLLVRSLGFFYRLIPSYGVAIILVTIALKVIFWPIQAKSIQSMKQMQKFQPQLQKLKEKYKDDAQRLNAETMKLYKEHHINPFSGCLPMLVQMPVLFAFYRVLLSDSALRGASFLWIKDLAQPDTVATVAGIAINPLPLVMVGAMIWQQKVTPQTGDSQQQKMMMFMPLMMLLFFYKAAAGLTLYWTLQQLLSFLQQWWSMRKDKLQAGKPA